MLQYLHDRVKGWFAYTFGIIIALTFGLLGVERYLFNNEVDRTAATINGEDLSLLEFDRAFERVRLQKQQALGRVITDQSELQKMKEELLDSMISKRLIVQKAKALGFVISEAEVNRFISNEIPALQVDGKFSNERLNQLLRSYNFTPISFKREIHDELLVGQLQSSIEMTQFAMPHEIRFAYALGYEKRDFRYVILKPEQFTGNLHITEQAAKDFYDKHLDEFTVPEKVSIEYLTISYDDVKKNIKVTNQDVKDYYEQNKDNYRTPAKWRIAHILIPARDEKDDAKAHELANKVYKELTKGGDFKVLAKKHSADVLSKNKGGELPWVTLGTLDKSIDTVMMQLKPGEIAKPFKSKYGYEVVKLLDKEESVLRDFAEVEQVIHRTLMQERSQHRFAEVTDELANITFTEPTSLNGAAQKLNLTVKTSEMFAQNNENKDLTGNPKVTQAAFLPDVLLQGNNSDVIPLDQTTALVLRVKEHQQKHVKPFAEVKQEIDTLLKQKIMHDRAKTYAEKIRNNLEQSKLLTDKGLNWVSKSKIDRRGADLDSKLIEALYKLPVTGKSNQQNTAIVEMSDGNIALLHMKESHPGKIEKLKKTEVLSIARQVARGYGVMDYQSLINSIKDHADIEKHKHKR